jgi:hypothetical protein
MYFFAEFFLRQTECLTQFKKAVAYCLIHQFKNNKETTKKQGLSAKGLQLIKFDGYYVSYCSLIYRHNYKEMVQ